MEAVLKLAGVAGRAKHLGIEESRSHAAKSSSQSTNSEVCEFRTEHARSDHDTSPRALRRTEAAELLALGMRVLRLVDKDVAVTLRVSETVVRGLRENTRPFTVGDYIEFRERLPALYQFIRDAINAGVDCVR